MAIARLSAREGIEVLDRALVLSLRHFWMLLRIALIPFLLYALFIRIYARSILGFTIRYSAFTLAYWCLTIAFGMVILVAWEAANGRAIDVTAIWVRVVRRGPSLMVASLLKVIGIFAGTLLLVIPGIYAAVFWFAVPGVHLIENLGAFAGLRRCAQLAKGSFEGVFCSLGLVYILSDLVQQGLSLGSHALGVRPGTLPLVSTSFALHFALLPMQGATGALVYLELLNKKEGYDLQTKLAALPDPAASMPDSP